MFLCIFIARTCEEIKNPKNNKIKNKKILKIQKNRLCKSLASLTQRPFLGSQEQ
jgi:hypothetical protein